jgi:dihydrofolate reductase
VSITSVVVRIDGESRREGRLTRGSEQMAKLVVINNLTLDGVMQAPGRPDEDVRGGFAHGGGAVPYNDSVKAEVMGKGMAQSASGAGALLLGRRTYEDFAGFWPKQVDNPFTPVLDAMQKYVVSTTLRDPLAWQNSTVLPGDAAESVASLKQRSEKDLTVLGSGQLVRTLAEHGLVDEYLLMIHPLLLGSGHRMFADDGRRTALRLVDSVTTSKGVVIATYQPDSPTPSS